MTRYYGISIENDFSYIYSSAGTNHGMAIDLYSKIPTTIKIAGEYLTVGEALRENEYQARTISYSSLVPELDKNFMIFNQLSAKDITSMILESLKKSKRPFVSSAAITCPSHYDDNKRTALFKAALAAGIKIERVIDDSEAVFASYLYDLANVPVLGNVMVMSLGKKSYDLGIMHKKTSGYQLYPLEFIEQKQWDELLLQCERNDTNNTEFLNKYFTLCKRAATAFSEKIDTILLTGDYCTDVNIQKAVAEYFGMVPNIYGCKGGKAKGAAICACNIAESGNLLSRSIGTNVELNGIALVDNILKKDTALPCQSCAKYKIINNQIRSLDIGIYSNFSDKRCTQIENCSELYSFSYMFDSFLPENTIIRICFTMVEPEKIKVSVEGVNYRLPKQHIKDIVLG